MKTKLSPDSISKHDVILYLLENPKNTMKSFFKGDISSYSNFRRKHPSKEIYREVNEILSKEHQAQIMQVEKELEKQGKDKAPDTIKLINTATTALATTIAYIKDQPLNFRYTSDAIKYQIKIMKFLLDIKKSGLISGTDENASYDIMIKRIDQLLEFSKSDGSAEVRVTSDNV